MSVERVRHPDGSVEFSWDPQPGAVAYRVVEDLGTGGCEVFPIHRVLCPEHGERAISLDGPDPMCQDCRVVGPDGFPLGSQDGLPT